RTSLAVVVVATKGWMRRVNATIDDRPTDAFAGRFEGSSSRISLDGPDGVEDRKLHRTIAIDRVDQWFIRRYRATPRTGAEHLLSSFRVCGDRGDDPIQKVVGYRSELLFRSIALDRKSVV